jgi:histidine triad (HIT) family protein
MRRTYPRVDGCPFCEILAGSSPAEIQREWDGAIAITPLNPVTDGHVIIIPRKHVADFTSETDWTAGAMWCAAEYAKTIGVDCNLITSKGEAATQTVYHLHIHVVPRAAGDGLRLPWTPA